MEIKRLALREYGSFVSLEKSARDLGITKNELLGYLDQVARRISEALNVNQPIEFNREGFRIIGVAGLIKLAPFIELEICPKFLSSSEKLDWREDFFTIASLTRFGRIFPEELLRSEIRERGDLADLIARAVIFLYDNNRRRPLRTYQKRVWKDLQIDGEIEPESVLFPDADGFTQAGILLDRQNRFNKVIHRAMEALVSEVKNLDTRRQLAKRFVDLGPQSSKLRRYNNKKLPHRHYRWQDLYDLSIQILDGLGLGFDEKLFAGLPGYIINTDNAWEFLIFNAVRSSLKNRKVGKIKHKFGQRQTPQSIRSRTATPDITIQNDSFQIPVDAKYKTRITTDRKEKLTIDAADVYESLAFMEALNSNMSLLIYPAPSDLSVHMETGGVAVFERITINGKTIIGLIVESKGISKRNGFYIFSQSIATALTSFCI